ncbi:hypothetical protein GCM10017674_80590 [Streptomyces gardneri]|uniref:Uncharacterized protein n=1 Tax=Streptomyces gardneri TaxID=66892 RepID=A0A4Y3RNL1_9ACTN|nr:hypothetical protein SGA01_30350 [Streptomyces gardneri]GHH23738.1 hypothetical protein GCM10017674_80590 [Streptomyces gardneri]
MQRRGRAAERVLGGGSAGPAQEPRRTGPHGGLLARPLLDLVAGSDENDPLAVDVSQLVGESVREPVVAADHHVAAVPWNSGVLVR